MERVLVTGAAGFIGANFVRLLLGDKQQPSSILAPDDERQWGNWLSGYRTKGQTRGLKFKPLHEITDEAYTVYFPVRPNE